MARGVLNKSALSPNQILKHPLITEKAAYSGQNSVVFVVHPEASKTQIKEAVEKAFEVKVKAVRTVNYLGKIKRVKSSVGRKAAWKKAVIVLAPGQSLNIIEGL